MAFSDLYEVLDRQSKGTSVILNVYHAEKVNPAFKAVDIANAFEDTIIGPQLTVQPDNLVHDKIDVRSLNDPLDFFSLIPSPNVGLIVADELTNFTAATIQFNRLRTDMKNGQKRFLAGSEGQASANVWTAAFITDLTTLGTALVTQWEDATFPGIPVCNFVIIKRICTTSPSPPCVGGYRLPLSTDPLTLYRPVTFIVRDTIRSQVSRKRLVS